MMTALEATGLSKRFGANKALDGVDLEVAAGEVLALMGANGAGKSTLVKILCGVYGADAGSIDVGGKTLLAGSPRQARARGIVAVHQTIADTGVPTLSVADNLLLDRYCASNDLIFAAGGSKYRAARKIADGVRLDVDLKRQLGALSIAERQLVAIARAVSHDPTVLILDEPTASLSAPESERLFAVIDDLRARGVAILYISHKLGDLRRIADRVMVLRDGGVVGNYSKPIDFTDAIHAMIGRGVRRSHGPRASKRGQAVLSVCGAKLRNDSAPFDFVAYAGEVVAVTGPVGAGKSTLAGAIFGRWPLAAGTMELDGKPWRPSGAGESIRRGVFMAGEDRWRTSFFSSSVPFAHIAGTIGFPFLRQWGVAGLVSRGAETRASRALIREFGIKTRGTLDALTTLSGGNQQKVVLARWHAEPARLLLLDEPFQGIDIGARNDIIQAIRAKSRDRATVVFVNDLEEALEVADRVVVLVDHSIAGDRDGTLAAAAELLASAGPVIPQALS
jgi:simple sugar transport system ATP-binding protein